MLQLLCNCKSGLCALNIFTKGDSVHEFLVTLDHLSVKVGV